MGILKDFEKRIKEAGNNTNFYTGVIYCYTNKINGKKYIGKTYNENGRKHGHKTGSKKPKQYFHKALKKYGWENFNYEVLHKKNYLNIEDLNFDLDLKEIISIKDYNTTDNKVGYNIGNGGGGSNGNKGKRMSEETRLKIISTLKQIPHSEEWINKAAEGHYKSVEQYSLDGKYIRTFKSIKEATYKFTDGKYSHLIGAVCTGKRKSAYGYLWKFKNTSNEVQPYMPLRAKKRIGKFDLNDNLIAEYNSISEAILNTNYYVTNISKCCNNKTKTAYGYKWKYVD